MAYQDLARRRHRREISPQTKSVASILAIICAVASFFFAHAAVKFGLAGAAIVFAIVGMIRATSRRVSGGILSIVAIIIAGAGLLVAVLDLVGLL